MDICTFWLGPRLRKVDYLCLSSMVKTGQRVKLFAHAPIENLPAGVEWHDAEKILPLEILYKLDPHFPGRLKSRAIVQFSDFFRVMLMKHQQGVWLDTDVYLVKQFHSDPDHVYLARENRSRVGVSALYFPADNPIIAEFENYLAEGKVVPQWLGFNRRVWRPLKMRLKGQEFFPKDLGITIFGNDGISRLAKKYGFFKNAAPKENFYYWNGSDALRIFDPKYGLEPIYHPDFIGFHIHKKSLSEQPAIEGSFYDWAIKRLDGVEFSQEFAKLL